MTLKSSLARALKNAGHTIHDVSDPKPDDDYPIVTSALTKKILDAPASRGILICGSGVGVSIAANRTHGIRAALGFSVRQVRAARSEDDANVLALAADFLDTHEAMLLTEAFLETPFDDRTNHARRIHQLDTAL